MPNDTYFHLREFKLSDLPQILRLEKALFGPDAYSKETILNGYKRADKGFIVAESDRKILGYVTGFVERRRSFIDNLAVAKKFQRRGLGQTLLNTIIKHFVQNGLKKIELVVKIDNFAAMQFYQKNGFTQIKRIKKVYADGSDGLLMQSKINESHS